MTVAIFLTGYVMLIAGGVLIVGWIARKLGWIPSQRRKT